LKQEKEGDSMTPCTTIYKQTYQKKYWLKKAIQYGIETEGREEQAARDAEARYRREYRNRNKTG